MMGSVCSGFMFRTRPSGTQDNGFGTNFIFRRLIAELAARYRLPSLFWAADVLEAGGVLV